MAIYVRRSNKNNPHKLTVTSTKNSHNTERSKNVEVRCVKLRSNHPKNLGTHTDGAQQKVDRQVPDTNP